MLYVLVIKGIWVFVVFYDFTVFQELVVMKKILKQVIVSLEKGS